MAYINTVVFDLDGTLLNTLEDLADSVNAMLVHYAYPQRHIDEIRRFIGTGVERLVELSIPDGLKNPNFDSCLKYFKDYYFKNMYNKTKPYDGIMFLLEELRKRNCKMAIVSNKPDKAVKKLSLDYFANFFDVAIGESKHIRRKPAPDSIFTALNQLGSNIRESVYIGDSEIDVRAAKNAGILCVGVTWGFRDRSLLADEGADYIIDFPLELLGLIDIWQNKK